MRKKVRYQINAVWQGHVELGPPSDQVVEEGGLGPLLEDVLPHFQVVEPGILLGGEGEAVQKVGLAQKGRRALPAASSDRRRTAMI